MRRTPQGTAGVKAGGVMELGLRGGLPGVKDGLREVEEPSKMVLAEEREPVPREGSEARET